MVLARQSRVALAIGAAVLLGGWLAWAALRLPRAPRPVERAPDVDASVAGPGSAPDAPSTEPAEPDAPARGSAERHDARPASPEPATARPARGIEGELLDVHTGLPVPGARVALAADDGAVEAAEDGRFALPGAAVPDEAALAFAVTLDTGERFELEHAGPSPGAGWIRLEVAASYELRGTVVDAAERGIGGAAVCLLGRGSAGLAELGAASSDEAGAFALRVPTAPNLSPSTLLVSADAAALFERPVVFDRLAVDLGRVPLEDGWAISGRVVGPHDASVPASVEAVRRESSERDVYSSLGRVHWEDGRAYRERARAPVRENGLFELRGLDRASYALRLLRDVRCNRPDPGGALVVTAPARDVALPDSRAVLLLEVVDAHGEALALAELRVGESPTGCPADRAGLLAVALPAGELDATVTCPGFLPQELRRTLVPGSVVRERVVLAGELVTGTLVVSAVDAEGEPTRTPTCASTASARTARPSSAPCDRRRPSCPPRGCASTTSPRAGSSCN